MSYHHLALAVRDMKATHEFYEGVMGFELVKVEIGNTADGGWGKHFFYRLDGDDTKFVAFWELHETAGQDQHEYELNAAANLPPGTNHYAFNVDSVAELDQWRSRWNEAGLDVLEIDHNWCHSVYTRDPSGNIVEFCFTSGEFSAADRARALAALEETTFQPSPAPAKQLHWPAAS